MNSSSSTVNSIPNHRSTESLAVPKIIAKLRRCGVQDANRALNLLSSSALARITADLNNFEQLIYQIARVGDPDLACLQLVRLAENLDNQKTSSDFKTVNQLEALALNGGFPFAALLALIGGSQMLGDYLIAHVDLLELFAHLKPFSISLAQQVNVEVFTTTSAEFYQRMKTCLAENFTADQLREAYWRELLTIAACDLAAGADSIEVLPWVCVMISDLVQATLELGLEIARLQVLNAGVYSSEIIAQVDLAVIGMGKLGARELNYISDVDVIYVARRVAETSDSISDNQMLTDDDLNNISTKIVTTLQQVVSGLGEERELWPIDPNLRPEGKNGPLVRTLESYQQYYQHWAKSWEYQALLKARPVAGSKTLGQAFMEIVEPLVWQAAAQENFVSQAQAMRKRVEAHSQTGSVTESSLGFRSANSRVAKRGELRLQDSDRRLKLGPGGLRDVEFSVQLLQLVHGRTDQSLRIADTFSALRALCKGSYIGRKDAASLAQDYKFLRCIEHRAQLWRLQRTHLLPAETRALRVLARSIGLIDAQTLENQWVDTKRRVRKIHLSLFYRPLLPLTAGLSTDEVSLSQAAAIDRLHAIGYRDANRALTNIKVITKGISRASQIQRHLIPGILEWIAKGPKPDAGILNFRLLSEKMGHTSWFLALLRDSNSAAKRLATLLSSSDFVAEQLPRVPEAVAWLDDDSQLQPRSRLELYTQAKNLVQRYKISSNSIAIDSLQIAKEACLALRALRAREILRLAMAQILEVCDYRAIQQGLSALTEAILEVGLEVCTTAVAAKTEWNQTDADFKDLPAQIGVLAMGRLGGAELNFASDADVIFLYMPYSPKNSAVLQDENFAETSGIIFESNAVKAKSDKAAKFAEQVVQIIVSSFTHLAEQLPMQIDMDLRPEGKNGVVCRSLTSFADYLQKWGEPWERLAYLRARPIAGSPEFFDKVTQILNAFRYTPNLPNNELVAIRRMKARVETERLPKSISPARHLKYGPGGLVDVEWIVQIWQAQFAYENPSLQTSQTIVALSQACKIGYCSAAEAEILQQSWCLASKLRDAIALSGVNLASSKHNILPSAITDLEILARIIGYSAGSWQILEEDWARLSRQCRAVCHRLIFGTE